MKVKIKLYAQSQEKKIIELERDITKEQLARFRRMRGCQVTVPDSQIRALLINVVEVRDWFAV